MTTLPHCTGCTEPGAVTHQQETAEHIHDACNATIAALREELEAAVDAMHTYGGDAEAAFARTTQRILAHPLPPAAAKLLAERDAGRALFEALRTYGQHLVSCASQTVTAANTTAAILCDCGLDAAIEAYRKVVD